MARNRYDEDEVLEIGFNKNYLKRLMAYGKPYKKTIMINSILMIIASILSLLGPLFIQIALDKMIPNNNLKGLIALSSLFLLTLIVISLIMKKRLLEMGEVGQGIIADMRKDLFEHLQALPFNYYDERPHGKILVRVVNYINALSDLMTNGIVNLAADLVTLCVALGFMFCLNTKLALVSLAGLPILMLVLFILKNIQRKVHQVLSSKQSNMNAYVHESINGIKVTQAFVREDENMDIYKEVCGEYRKAWFNMVKVQFIIWPAIDIISVLSVSMIYLFGIFVLGDSLTIGVLVGFVAYVWRFWAPIESIGNLYNNLINAMAYLERIFEMLDEKITIHDGEDAGVLPQVVGDVTFDHVTFMYEKDEPILKDMSFRVEHGDTIAIVGPTGAGKTTIVNLLSRFYNVNSGCIRIDGTDINTVTLQSLRKQMGVMLQDSFIFAGTIMENIRYGKLDATDEEVIAAAKRVCAHDFIIQFKEGYQSEVNERGSRLSVGQRQLISFARVLLSNPRILILDEATSSIDTQTERLLQQGLEELLKGRTAFIIAHRLSTIKNATEIFYIDKGKILERGTHQDLINNKGPYYQLCTVQNNALKAI